MNQLDPRATMSTLVLSISGGKDSAAVALYLRELGLDFLRVFADTKWEHPDTYAYLRGPLQAAVGPIDEVRGRDRGMANLIRRKRMFPSRLRRFCTEELKVLPLQFYIQCVEAFDQRPVVNVVGIRNEESAARASATEWEWSEAFDCWVWRPIVRWTEQQVIDIHTRHGLAPNPLYLRGANRVGCWPCIFARKGEIRRLQETPDRIAEIAALEDEIPPVPSRDGMPPMPRTFFTGVLNRGRPASVQDSVAWANTARGTKDQGVLFHDLGQPEGCVRWGLCEAGKQSEDDEPEREGGAK